MISSFLRLTFSSFEKPINRQKVVSNMIRFMGRWTLITGSLVIISDLFNRCLKEGSWPASLAFQANLLSLASSITSAGILAYFIYEGYGVPSQSPEGEDLHWITIEFEKKMMMFSSPLLLGTMLAYDHLKGIPVLQSISSHDTYPLLFASITATVIWFYHRHQFKSAENYSPIPKTLENTDNFGLSGRFGL